MLIEFSTTNFRSIKSTQTLSLVANQAFKEKGLEGNLFGAGINENGLPQLLRSAVVYGPNAAGKSTLIGALSFMRTWVTKSAQKAQIGEPIKDVQPFLLSADSSKQDSEFEIHFIEAGVRYQYGFSLNSERVTSEWLIAYPVGKPQLWFERVFDPASKKEKYKYGSYFLGGKKLHKDRELLTIGSALYLSVAVQKGNEQLKPVFSWFQERLRVVPGGMGYGFTAKSCKNKEEKARVLEFMRSADISVDDISIEEKIFSKGDLPAEIPAVIKDEIARSLEGKTTPEVTFLHKMQDSEALIPFALEDESDGTSNLFAFAGPWLDVLKNEYVLVVDEIDTSLHPLIVHHLVRMLNSDTGHAQLIFTTHDTTLLSQRILRRDQIWFVEKDKDRSTHLYTLADFSPRENEAIEKGYLNGRYGAIPFLSKLDFYGQR